MYESLDMSGSLDNSFKLLLSVKKKDIKSEIRSVLRSSRSKGLHLDDEDLFTPKKERTSFYNKRSSLEGNMSNEAGECRFSDADFNCIGNGAIFPSYFSTPVGTVDIINKRKLKYISKSSKTSINSDVLSLPVLSGSKSSSFSTDTLLDDKDFLFSPMEREKIFGVKNNEGMVQLDNVNTNTFCSTPAVKCSTKRKLFDDSMTSVNNETETFSPDTSINRSLNKRETSYNHCKRQKIDGRTASVKRINKSRVKKKVVSGIPVTLEVVQAITPRLKRRLLNLSEEPAHLSFLSSLSTTSVTCKLHPDSVLFKTNYNKSKEQLVKILFDSFNKDVFENKLPENMKIEWSNRISSTSGYCYNRSMETKINGKKSYVRVSRIVLSSKILTTPERLRDTLIHEMCHSASWIVDNIPAGHGPVWISWANRANKKLPELPPIKVCHNFDVNTKFRYRCTTCGYIIGRHKNSLNLVTKRCGICYSRFELISNIKPDETQEFIPKRQKRLSMLEKKFFNLRRKMVNLTEDK